MDYLNRNMESKINRLLASFPIVAILGARQCGKSTIAKNVTKNWAYFDLENPNHYDLITSDPILFFREHTAGVIIDEAQKFPGLFEVLRSVVDQDSDKNGRYIITGSASFSLVKDISESLAGRVALVELAPFKCNEFYQTQVSPFFKIFEKKLVTSSIKDLKKLISKRSISEIKRMLFYGGYPKPALSSNIEYHQDWLENYFENYINRDMRMLFPRMDLLKYRRIVSMLSSISGTIINKADIARSIEASEKSTRDYLEIISGTYFWRELPAYRTPKVKTTIKMPKGHFRDSGLAFFLQRVTSLDDLSTYHRLGNIFESFVVEEIIRGLESSNCRQLSYFHYRTKAGAEIDLIVEGQFGTVPIEIKYASHTSKKDVIALENFIESHKLPFGIVINNCESPHMITEKIIQIPVGCL